jgi:hypothetical protein
MEVQGDTYKDFSLLLSSKTISGLETTYRNIVSICRNNMLDSEKAELYSGDYCKDRRLNNLILSIKEPGIF